MQLDDKAGIQSQHMKQPGRLREDSVGAGQTVSAFHPFWMLQIIKMRSPSSSSSVEGAAPVTTQN